MKTKDYLKLHSKTVKQVKKYTDAMIESGVKKESWTFVNDFVVTFRDLKRKPRSKK